MGWALVACAMACSVPTGDAHPAPIASTAPSTAQPGDASRSCSSGRKYSCGLFRGKMAQMLPTDKCKLSSFYHQILLACLWFNPLRWGLARDTAQAERGSLEACEEEESSELCRSPAAPPAPTQGGWGGLCPCHCFSLCPHQAPTDCDRGPGTPAHLSPVQCWDSSVPPDPLLHRAAPSATPLPGQDGSTGPGTYISAALAQPTSTTGSSPGSKPPIVVCPG